MPQTRNFTKITAHAFEHALRLIRENYPLMSEERQQIQAYRLAERICKQSKL